MTSIEQVGSFNDYRQQFPELSDTEAISNFTQILIKARHEAGIETPKPPTLVLDIGHEAIKAVTYYIDGAKVA
jgi:hypothetical protein